MTQAVFAGSFDPFTNGHLTVLKKALKVFDKVYVVIASNPAKNRRYNPYEVYGAIRATLKREELADRAEVVVYNGILVELMQDKGVIHTVRGLRDATDFEYEENLAKINKGLYKECETVYFRADFDCSSSKVKELFDAGKSVAELVPCETLDMMKGEFIYD